MLELTAAKFVCRIFLSYHLGLRDCMGSNGLLAVRSSLGSTDGAHRLRPSNFRFGVGGAMRVLGVTSTASQQRGTAGRCHYLVPPTLPPVVAAVHYRPDLVQRL